MRFQVFLSLWSVTSCSCIDEIPKVAKTKVSNPKRNSLSKLRLVHAPLKRLIQTRPNMSTSRCGNICVTNIWKEGVVSVTAVVLMQLSGRRCVFLCESKSTLFGLPKVDAIRNHWLRFVYNTTAQPKCLNLYNAFYGRQFSEPSRVQGWLCKKAISKKKKKKGQFRLCYDNLPLLNQRL